MCALRAIINQTLFRFRFGMFWLGISMGSLRKYPITVVPIIHKIIHQTHKLPYTLDLSRRKCDYPKHSRDTIAQEVCANDLVSEHFKWKKGT